MRGPLVYAENARGTYYLTAPTLQDVVERHGGKFQTGPANSSTTVVVQGDLGKEKHGGVDTWQGSKKQLALDDHGQHTTRVRARVTPVHLIAHTHWAILTFDRMITVTRAAAGQRKKPLRVVPFAQFVSDYDLEDDIEPELLWAFCHVPNCPPPHERLKHFLGIGNSTLVGSSSCRPTHQSTKYGSPAQLAWPWTTRNRSASLTATRAGATACTTTANGPTTRSCLRCTDGRQPGASPRRPRHALLTFRRRITRLLCASTEVSLASEAGTVRLTFEARAQPRSSVAPAGGHGVELRCL